MTRPESSGRTRSYRTHAHFVTRGALAIGLLLGAATLAQAEAVAPSSDEVAEHLAGALRFPTISPADPADFKGTPFVELAAYLAETYPRVHAQLDVETVADYSLLFRWQGSNTSLEPALFMSHLDVVPVEPGTESQWTHPPFSGAISDGYVWGRGALDVKVGVIVWLEAVEALLAAGVVPERTIYLAFGHDEEIGGEAGAAAIAQRLEARGVRLAFLFDEGGLISSDNPLFPDRSTAMVCVAEKTYVTLKLTATGQGGHSSIPPAHTSIGKLATAIHRIEANPMPPRLTEAFRGMLEAAAPYQSFSRRFAFNNLWLTKGSVLRSLQSDPLQRVMVQTTSAATVIQGGVKENVLPTSARALVNFRIVPGDTTDDVVAHVREVIDQPDVEIEVLGWSSAPKPASLESEGYALIRDAVAETIPNAVVVPGLLPGATDTRHYTKIVEDAYRFVPVHVNQTLMAGFHGLDERIAVEPLGRSVAAAMRMVEGAARPGR